MAENFPDLKKNINVNSQEALQIQVGWTQRDPFLDTPVSMGQKPITKRRS